MNLFDILLQQRHLLTMQNICAIKLVMTSLKNNPRKMFDVHSRNGKTRFASALGAGGSVLSFVLIFFLDKPANEGQDTLLDIADRRLTLKRGSNPVDFSE